MAQAAKSQEPSMEEILASIRRIVAEDDADKMAQRAAEATSVGPNPEAVEAAGKAERTIGESYFPPPESPAARIGGSSGNANAAFSSSVLDLTEPMAAPPPGSDAVAADSTPTPVPSATIDHAEVNEPVTRSGGGAHKDERGGLMSSATSAAIDSAFNALAQTVLVHNARTLEDLVREMLRPMLKVWLDDNLPGIVERLVRAEIERVSGGRGG